MLREQDQDVPSPEVIAPDQTLKTGANAGTSIVFAHLDGLVHPAIAVTKVCALRPAQMNTETFRGAMSGIEVRSRM